jgi:hypothetical protein
MYKLNLSGLAHIKEIFKGDEGILFRPNYVATKEKDVPVITVLFDPSKALILHWGDEFEPIEEPKYIQDLIDKRYVRKI